MDHTGHTPPAPSVFPAPCLSTPSVSSAPGPRGAGPHCSSGLSAQRALPAGSKQRDCCRCSVHQGQSAAPQGLVCARWPSPCPHTSEWSFGNRSPRLGMPEQSQPSLHRVHLQPAYCTLISSLAELPSLGSQFPPDEWADHLQHSEPLLMPPLPIPKSQQGS